jgi:hypothetical protein
MWLVLLNPHGPHGIWTLSASQHDDHKTPILLPPARRRHRHHSIAQLEAQLAHTTLAMMVASVSRSWAIRWRWKAVRTA